MENKSVFQVDVGCGLMQSSMTCVRVVEVELRRLSVQEKKKGERNVSAWKLRRSREGMNDGETCDDSEIVTGATAVSSTLLNWIGGPVRWLAISSTELELDGTMVRSLSKPARDGLR